MFERPEHTFVGYFIGSPGMNLLDAKIDGNMATIGSHQIPLGAGYTSPEGHTQIGIRPEFVTFTTDASCLPVQVTQVEDVGRHRIVRVGFEGNTLCAVLPEGTPLPEGTQHIAFMPEQIGVFANDWRVTPQTGGAS